MNYWGIYLHNQTDAKIKCKGGQDVVLLCKDDKCYRSANLCGDSQCICRCEHIDCKKPICRQYLTSKVQYKTSKYKEFQRLNKKKSQKLHQMIDHTYEFMDNYQKVFIDQLTKLQFSERRFIDVYKNGSNKKLMGKNINTVLTSSDNYGPNEKALKDNQDFMKIWFQKLEQINLGFLKDFKQSVKLRGKQLMYTSKIIDYPTQQQIIFGYIKQQKLKFSQLTLLYRGSQNKFSPQKFHQLCDGYQNTLVLYKNKSDQIFGGFAVPSWDSSGEYRSDPTKKSFVFNLAQDNKRPLKSFKQTILCDQNSGPLFGNSDDLQISNCYSIDHQSFSTVNNSYENNIHSFTNPEKYKIMNEQTYIDISFLKQIQVFKLQDR